MSTLPCTSGLFRLSEPVAKGKARRSEKIIRNGDKMGENPATYASSSHSKQTTATRGTPSVTATSAPDIQKGGKRQVLKAYIVIESGERERRVTNRLPTHSSFRSCFTTGERHRDAKARLFWRTWAWDRSGDVDKRGGVAALCRPPKHKIRFAYPRGMLGCLDEMGVDDRGNTFLAQLGRREHRFLWLQRHRIVGCRYFKNEPIDVLDCDIYVRPPVLAEKPRISLPRLHSAFERVGGRKAISGLKVGTMKMILRDVGLTSTGVRDTLLDSLKQLERKGRQNLLLGGENGTENHSNTGSSPVRDKVSPMDAEIEEVERGSNGDIELDLSILTSSTSEPDMQTTSVWLDIDEALSTEGGDDFEYDSRLVADLVENLQAYPSQYMQIDPKWMKKAIQILEDGAGDLLPDAESKKQADMAGAFISQMTKDPGLAYAFVHIRNLSFRKGLIRPTRTRVNAIRSQTPFQTRTHTFAPFGILDFEIGSPNQLKCPDSSLFKSFRTGGVEHALE
ncbi:hypothetical protein BDZ89DRAFT_1047120 [Hymenopellis radicata]|nr:hypothetical protein BDZ89DRAFT_1047120 [Hymenopellis radicata]